MRRQFRGKETMVRIGFGSNKKTRFTLPNGLKKFVVHNLQDVDLLLMHNRIYCAEIAHNVSGRLRKAIIDRAEALNIVVTNGKARLRTAESEAAPAEN